MSYTLRGRLQSRLAASLVPLLVACALSAALPAWWPFMLAGLMLGVGLSLDVLLYDVVDYQPGWFALPFGLLELALIIGLVRALDIHAPLWPALVFFAGAWGIAQVLGHAGFPLLALSYADAGGELGRAGVAALGVSVLMLGAAGAVFWAKLPPTVHLHAGVHRGPLVLDRAQTLVGDAGAIVQGGIVIHASHVIVRNVTVVGGEDGIVVDGARHVLLDGVLVRGAALDGIHVRRSQVHIRNCTIESPQAGYTQGIDISFAIDKGMSSVEGCALSGGREGIVTHSAMVEVKGNTVSRTSLRGIDMTEMSMGSIEHNRVSGGLGVGIFCGDFSECEIGRNHVRDTRPDGGSGDLTRLGVGIEVHRGATAELHENELVGNPTGVATFLDARVHRRR